MNWINLAVTILCSVLASSGLWAYIQNKHSKNDALTQLVVGLAHDRLRELSMTYIQRGYITPDEYENFKKYIYMPYHQNGGNGSGDRFMAAVDSLPVKPA